MVLFKLKNGLKCDHRIEPQRGDKWQPSNVPGFGIIVVIACEFRIFSSVHIEEVCIGFKLPLLK